MKPDKFNNPHQTGTPTGTTGGLNKGTQGGAGAPQGKQQWGGGTTANQQGKKPIQQGNLNTNKGTDTRRDK